MDYFEIIQPNTKHKAIQTMKGIHNFIKLK